MVRSLFSRYQKTLEFFFSGTQCIFTLFYLCAPLVPSLPTQLAVANASSHSDQIQAPCASKGRTRTRHSPPFVAAKISRVFDLTEPTRSSQRCERTT